MLQARMGQSRENRSICPSIAGTQRQLIHGGQAFNGVKLGRLENRPMRDLGQASGAIVPVDEIAILSILDEISDPTGFRDNYRDPATQGLGCGEQESLLSAVTQQDSGH